MQRKIEGMRCVVLKRCSSAAQIGSSMENQRRSTEECVREHKLEVVEEILLEGVTGSVPHARTDIDAIIVRKRNRNDFKLLIVQDATRFTRAGQSHGQKLLYDLRAAGILVYFVAEDLLIDNEMAEMYVSFLFSASRDAVKRISYGATAGGTRSYLDGKSPYSRRPPYGLDRMYSVEGVDRHIIRNLPDGTQVQLDPKSGEVIQRFGKNQRKGVPAHYIKQKSEEVRLVPGDPEHVRVVQSIFYQHDVQHKSARQIARELNDSGVPGPNGGEWYSAVVSAILYRPIYVGMGIRYRARTGIYYNGGAEGQPRASEVELEELATRRRPRARRRPREEWVERPQPHLVEFLPAEVREISRRRIERHLEAVAEARPAKPDRDRHRTSPYLLKGLIRSKQGGYPLTGRQSGKPGKIVRYYCVSRGESVPRSNDVLRRRVPAEPLERAVLDVVREVLTRKPDLVAGIDKLIEAEAKRPGRATGDIEEMRRELKRCRRQMVVLSETLSGDEEDEDDVIVRKVEALRRKIAELQQRIREAEAPAQAVADADRRVSAASLVEELHRLGHELDPADVPGIRNLLQLIIRRFEVDLETKQVEIEFALPSWLTGAFNGAESVGLDQAFACKPLHEAHTESSVILARFDCDYTRQSRRGCFECRRRAA